MTATELHLLLTQLADAVDARHWDDAYELVTEAQAHISQAKTSRRRPWDVVLVWESNDRSCTHQVRVTAASRALAHTAAQAWGHSNLDVTNSTLIRTHIIND